MQAIKGNAVLSALRGVSKIVRTELITQPKKLETEETTL